MRTHYKSPVLCVNRETAEIDWHRVRSQSSLTFVISNESVTILQHRELKTKNVAELRQPLYGRLESNRFRARTMIIYSTSSLMLLYR